MALGDLIRLTHAGYVLAREGAFALADPEALPSHVRFAVRAARLIERRGIADSDRADRLTAALNRLGPSYIKLGQFLATRPDLVGPEAAEGLGRLRDEIEPFPDAEARAVIARDLGRSVEMLFDSLSPPVAAASIAQVHRGEITDADGARRVVAVKVLRPGVRRRFHRDIATFYAGARFVERVDPLVRRLKPLAVVDTLDRSVTIEMDLRLEAAALSEMAENTEADPGFRVPAVDWARTGRDVLTLEWIDGLKLSQVSALAAAGHDLPELARQLMQSFLRHALRDGFFHADMHQGNLFVDAEARIVAVDFGIMGRLGRAERRFLAEILYGFIRRDYRRVAEVHMEAGYVPRRHHVEDFAQALRAIGEPIHGQPARDISMARLLTLLFEVTELFDMETRPELILLQKTMVVVEGVARSLDPDFDMWSTSEPVVGDWIQRHLGPPARLEEAGEALSTLLRSVAAIPDMAERAERLSKDLVKVTEEGVALDHATLSAIRRIQARVSWPTRIALWILALSALIAAMRYATA